MAHVPQTQALYSQDTTQTQGTPQTQATPQMQGQTGFTIPVHCGLLTLISDLNKLHIDIKSAARDVATVAGGVLLQDPVKETTEQLQELRDKLTNLPVLKILATQYYCYQDFPGLLLDNSTFQQCGISDQFFILYMYT